MKNLFKILLAVVALAVVGCTTDTTEDFGVTVDGQQTITLSLEESRTQLGTEVNGLYPLTWSEGDKISVNGVESGEAIIDSNNPANASFVVSGSAPYCIAYPAAPEGQVLFAAEQEHVSDTTFGNGVATMYGYGESGFGVHLHHLTGVLKIAVTGSGVLTYAQISTIDRAPIAGAFNIDFESGKVTATPAAKSVINYAFPSDAGGDAGLVLSNDPQYLHIAVPAGEYDELYVTLYDDAGGVMYATVKADDTKPLTAGKVRNFKTPIVYVPNANVHIIKDAETLKAFAAAAPTSNKDALFVADVDMTGETWTPIEGYANTVLGNGYSIKGLTAPLFGKTNASIKGLHLVDVNINETKNPNVGAFARQISATDTVSPSIEHCTASGKIVVNCAEYVVPNPYGWYHDFTVGGIAGTLFGTSISDCSSSINLDIDQQVVAGNTKEIRPGVGGVVGALIQFDRTDATVVYSPMVNCSNSGNIEYANGSYNGETDAVALSLGGVLGITFSTNRTAEISNLNNSGNITFDATFTTKVSRIGGVIGWAYTDNLSKCVNSGNFTYNSGAFISLYYGGIVGYPGSSCIINDVHNKGNITIKGEVKQLADLVLGGIAGYQQNGDVTGYLNNAINDGAITIGANLPENTEENLFRIGGIAGWSQCVNNYNTNNGDITISGKLYNANSKDHTICVAGIVGYKTVDAADNVENNGDITVSANVGYTAGTDCRLWVAGIFGYGNAILSNAKNTGDIEVTGTQYYLCVGGVSGYFGNQVTNVENTGDIKIKTASIGSSLYVSGCLARSEAAPDPGYIQTNLINRGSISVEADASKNMYVGGCVGNWNEQVKVAIRAAENYGAITVKATSSGSEACIGGVISYMYGTSDSRGLHNHKSATINVNVKTTGGKLAVGGVAYGLRDALGAAKSGEPANGNDADIFVTGSTKTALDVGGIICVPNNYARSNATNNGNITVTGATVGTDLRVGGIECARNYGAKNTNYVNNGDIFIDSTTKVQGSVSVGGFAGGNGPMSVASAQTYEGCSNTGDITFSGEAGLSGSGSIRMGGLNAAISAIGASDGGVAFVDTFTNSGNITYNGKLHSTDGKVVIGGIIGEYMLNTLDNSTWTGEVVNTGNITCTGTHNGNTYIGGIFGETNKSFANGKVNCTINAEGYNNMGMVLGSPRTAEVVASNFKVAGKISAEYEGDGTWELKDITEDNFFNYIYGSATDWAGTENYDGCTFLTE
ncbi:MAG: hypothetical protein IKA04_00985 [Alistipes sp.]|nr:hypothetical protein [Alistipes sp.]